MFLLSYQYQDDAEGKGWVISHFTFNQNNLFIGVSGSGKSRTLNTLWNVGNFISTNIFRDGIWDIEFKIEETIYKWHLHSVVNNGEKIIIKEKLSTLLPNNEEKIIFERKENNFTIAGAPSPKLPKDSTGIYLLREEDAVKRIHEEFGRILRRNFFGGDLVKACSITSLHKEFNQKISKEKLSKFLEIDYINVRLHLLSIYDNEKFKTIIDEYKSIFPFVENIVMLDGSKIIGEPGLCPVAAIKEQGVNNPIMLHELSSGMQKVLLIITDILTLHDESIYIIDEYENSLGINAINFLPDFISTYGQKYQFITTTHHPYLINNIPVSDWKIFTRFGSKVSIRNGSEIEENYKKSNQDAFVQLMNDPEYTGI